MSLSLSLSGQLTCTPRTLFPWPAPHRLEHVLAFARFKRDAIGKIRNKQSAIALCAQIYGERTLDPCRVGRTQPPIWDAEKLQLYSPELLIPLVGHFHFLAHD